jgi:hypothetical protein
LSVLNSDMSNTTYNRQRAEAFENGFQYEKPQSFTDAQEASDQALLNREALIAETIKQIRSED